MPRIVRQSAELLRDAVGRYVFVSSISVYADFSGPITEATPVAELEDPATEEVARALRRAEGCVRASRRGGLRRPQRARPRRADRRPVRPDRPVHVLAAAHRRGRRRARAGRSGRTGAVRRRARPRRVARAARARGPGRRLQRNGPCGAARRSPSSSTVRARRSGRTRTSSGRTSSASSTPACSRGRSCRSGCPEPTTQAWPAADISRAVEAGLRFRPVEETVLDTLAWDRSVPGDRPTLAADKEAEILAAA